MPDNKNICHSCTDCGVLNCARRSGSYPEFCPTAALTEEEINEVTDLYIKNRTNHKIAVASAEVEGGFYGKYTRVEEIIEFARKIGVKKIGIATCVGLIEESRIFARILKLNGFEVYGIGCKVGSVDKTDIGIDEKYTCVTGKVMCNPIMQAKLLNKAKVDLNVVVGLCVGHDSLFYKYAKGDNDNACHQGQSARPQPCRRAVSGAGLLQEASAYAGRRGAGLFRSKSRQHKVSRKGHSDE